MAQDAELRRVDFRHVRRDLYPKSHPQLQGMNFTAIGCRVFVGLV